MSTTTDVLSLFKYDPVADADSTFNITQALNNNWDKLDAALLLAIAAAGAYNPEESYAVGDYCTYKGKLHKCSTAIPTGETWTEAHWTTTTVAAELAELSSQLSNKIPADLGIKMLGDVNSPNKVPAGQSCIFRVTDSNWDGKLPNPYSVCARLRSGNSGSYDLWIFSDGENLWFFRAGDAGFPQSADDFVKVANAMPPQEFDLPLAEGLQPVPAYGSNKYRKNQFNEVGITISVTKTDIATNDIENSSLLATLPAGFRPATIVSGAAFVARGAESVVYPACIVIYPDGSVIMNQSNGVSCSMVIASISFLAAN